MSRYIENHLRKDEEIVIKAKKNWLYLLPSTLFFVILLVLAIIVQTKISSELGFIDDDPELDILLTITKVIIWVMFALIGCLPLIGRIFNLLSINLVLTNKRLVGKIGILRVHSLDIPIDKIDHCEIKASVFGNLFRYFELRICSMGGSGYNSGRAENGERYVAISNAQQFKDAVTDAIERHAEEARKAQAAEIAAAMSNRPQY